MNVSFRFSSPFFSDNVLVSIRSSHAIIVLRLSLLLPLRDPCAVAGCRI